MKVWGRWSGVSFLFCCWVVFVVRVVVLVMVKVFFRFWVSLVAMGSFLSEWLMLLSDLKLMGWGELRSFFRSNVRLAVV